jgi:hypothetical protein
VDWHDEDVSRFGSLVLATSINIYYWAYGSRFWAQLAENTADIDKYLLVSDLFPAESIVYASRAKVLIFA